MLFAIPVPMLHDQIRMLKKSREEKALNLMKFIDPLLVGLVWWLCYLFRFRFLDGEAGLESVFAWSGGILSALTVYMYSRSGLYRSARLKPLSVQVFDIIRAHTLTVLIFVVLVYFTFDRRLSRGAILFYLAVSLCVQVFARVALNAWLARMRRRKLDPLRVFIAGQSAVLSEMLTTWRSHPEFGIELVGWYKGSEAARAFQVMEYAGGPSNIVQEHKPDLIVVADSSRDPGFVDGFLHDIHNDVVPIHILPDIPYSILGLAVESIHGHLVLKFNQPNFSAVELLGKRLMDIVGAACGLLLLSPLLAIIAIGVKVTSPGPIFFAQERIGLDGRRFKMWKFRSMRVSAEAESTWTTANDPRRTAFGTFLRKTSIDELPQMWNILVGDMSIVGPRPEQPKYVEQFRKDIPAYMLRHKMKAGLTGWAQVNGWRGDTDLTKRIDCDLYYIRNWSLWFDIKIIFLTVVKGFVNRNAY